MGLFELFAGRLSVRESKVLQGKVDRHSHILFGVDDGIRTIEDSLQAIALHETLGITDLWCTPHIMEDVPNTTPGLQARFEELRQAYKGGVRLHLAAEYMMDNLLEERLEGRDLLTMEDNMLLLETSTLNPPYGYKEILRKIMSAGYRPLLAHPERYRYMSDDDYAELRKMGVLFQLNLPSVLGYYGKTVQQKAEELLEKGYYDYLGSDCHRTKALLEPFDRKLLSRSTFKRLRDL